MIITLIAAHAQNLVIGKNNDLPWHLPDDMKFFMQTTKGHCCVMGRKNYDSIPQKFRPLPNRTNLVVTRQQNFLAEGCMITHSLNQAIAIANEKHETELFIIGGAEIYKLALPLAHKLYLTEIHAHIEGDTFFPSFDRQAWQEVSRVQHVADERHAYAFDFVCYQRSQPQ